jgi:NTP pyrophosphatase (non-canonical NTP hydrolase)
MKKTEPNSRTDALILLREELRRFAAERDWHQFHSPKNLAAALAVEAAELLEPFQWLTEKQSRHLDAEQLAAVRDEVADVLLYLIRLADELDIDLDAANCRPRQARPQRSQVSRRKGAGFEQKVHGSLVRSAKDHCDRLSVNQGRVSR